MYSALYRGLEESYDRSIPTSLREEPHPWSTPPSALQRHTQTTEAPRIDVDRVGDLLLGTWADTRRTAREMIKDPAFWRKDDLGKDEHRERVLSQLHRLVDNKAVHRASPKEYGGEDNNGANISGFEELVAADPSLQIKAGVQWGLFGSAIMQLGTEEHHRTLAARSHGPLDPRSLRDDRDRPRLRRRRCGTTATYDPDTEEFVIHTPFTCSDEGVPRQCRPARCRGHRLRAADHEWCQPWRALLLHAAPRR